MSSTGFLSRVLSGLGIKSGAGTDMTLAAYLDRFQRINESITGRSVGWEDALKVTTAFRCVQVLADGIATVPCKIMAEGPTGRAPARKHPLYDVLMLRANSWQTGLEYRETLGFHLALAGNHFAFKIRDRSNRILELWPLRPSYVSVVEPKSFSDKPTYDVKHPNGEIKRLTQDDIWHVPGPSWDGRIGLEPVRLAREALGLALSTEEHHARLHRNGARPGGLYTVADTLEPADYEKLKAWIESSTEGVENSFKTMILDRDAKFTPMTMTGLDSEHLATRRHQIEEVCRAFGVLPIMVGHANEQTTFASSENMFLAHVVHTIRPLHRRLEAAIDAGLLTDEDRQAGHYAKFFDAELLRGAAKDRAQYYSLALGSGGGKGWMTQNEVRAAEDEDHDSSPEADQLPQPPAPTAPAPKGPSAP